jgi:hypothetical protein
MFAQNLAARILRSADAEAKAAVPVRVGKPLPDLGGNEARFGQCLFALSLRERAR